MEDSKYQPEQNNSEETFGEIRKIRISKKDISSILEKMLVDELTKSINDQIIRDIMNLKSSE